MKILCATDLLPKSDAAINRAGILAERLRAKLSLVHVVQQTESTRILEEDVQRARVELAFRTGAGLWRYGAQPRVSVRTGDPARALVRMVKELEPDLVVIGRPRTRAARDFLLGTMASRVLAERKCPVLIVKNMAWSMYDEVVLALDLTSTSTETVLVTEALVMTDSARATIVHACQPPYESMLIPVGGIGAAVPEYVDGWSHAARTSLLTTVSEASNDHTRYRILVEHAPPSVAIRKAVNGVNADLLVVGTRGRGPLRRALLGSVAAQAVANAPCDVLVVPDRTALLDENRRDRRTQPRHASTSV